MTCGCSLGMSILHAKPNIIIVGLEESDENCEKLVESMIEERLLFESGNV